MQTGRKPVCNGEWVYLVILMLLLIPVCAMAGGIQLSFEWDPNPEPDIAGYRVFAREPGGIMTMTIPPGKARKIIAPFMLMTKTPSIFL